MVEPLPIKDELTTSTTSAVKITYHAKVIESIKINLCSTKIKHIIGGWLLYSSSTPD